MKILDNITSTVRDDLRVEIKKGSKVSIAAACFSMYAYKELKKQLETIDEFEQRKGQSFPRIRLRIQQKRRRIKPIHEREGFYGDRV
mgnify:CR=1 FL=1